MTLSMQFGHFFAAFYINKASSYEKDFVELLTYFDSARVIAVFNGDAGGTKNTIEYAKQVGIETVVIDPRSLY